MLEAAIQIPILGENNFEVGNDISIITSDHIEGSVCLDVASSVRH